MLQIGLPLTLAIELYKKNAVSLEKAAKEELKNFE